MINGQLQGNNSRIMDAMNWMDKKLKERDQRDLKPEESNTDAVEQHRRGLLQATEIWRELISLARVDIAKYNARSPERRINMSATLEFISLDWSNPPQEALLVSRKLNATTANYEARQKPDELRPHKGMIDLLTETAESLSEQLLEPVLFELGIR